LKLHRATAQDTAILPRVCVDSWQVAYRGTVPDAHLGRAVGILTIGPGRDPDLDVHLTGEISGIYISPESWRRGIGRELVRKAEGLPAVSRSPRYRCVGPAGQFGRQAVLQSDELRPAWDVQDRGLGAPVTALRYRKTMRAGAPPRWAACEARSERAGKVWGSTGFMALAARTPDEGSRSR
jgi:GNAT superfamily N-acetyltransferase